jgi:hypothetical protein
MEPNDSQSGAVPARDSSAHRDGAANQRRGWAWISVTSVAELPDKTFQRNPTFFLHLWKIPVVSNVRTNFSAISGI